MTGVVGAPPARWIDRLLDVRIDQFVATKSQSPLEPSQLMQATRQLIERLGDLTPRTPPVYELEETVARLRSEWRARRSLDRVETLHMRRAPWALFFPRSRPEQWLGRDRDLVRAWLAWLSERRRPTVIVALLREFLGAHPRDLPIFEELRQVLQRQLEAGEGPRMARWRERCQSVGLLEPDGPSRFASTWWETSIPFEGHLQGAGLAPGLESSAFVQRATEELLGQLEDSLRRAYATPASCSRAFAWLENDGGLRFQEARVDVANALLRPFLEAFPEARIQEPIGSFLCRAIGDPRIHRPRWQGVDDQVRNVLFRWLVGATLEDFFRVLDKTALDEHWTYRKAFWSAYLGGDHIQDAWVVLGPEASRLVRRGFGESASAGKLSTGNGVLPNHSVLLMRIHGLTIAEWSHNGTCRIWRQGNKRAPRTYEAQYSRSQLVDGSDWSQRHVAAPYGTWQGKVAEYIEHNTRIRVPRHRYMPRGWSPR